MANFDTLLSGLHNGLQEGARVTELANDLSPCLEVNSKRQFIPKNNFDTVIGYEGDINSQVILFKLLPESFGVYDSHKLSECETKLVKWKNNVSGFEGTSNLIIVDADNSYYKWEVDPSVFTKAGTIEISLTFEDKKDKLLAYSWNTSTYLGLSVGKSINTVDYSLPAKDEILIIDKDTKNILAPNGYNNLVCNRGEIGIAHLYFLVNKYLNRAREIDITRATIKLHVIQDNKLYQTYTSDENSYGAEKVTQVKKISYTLFSEEADENYDNNSLFLLDWTLPSDFTSNYEGTFGIVIEFCDISKELPINWLSNNYSNLKIGTSPYAMPKTPEFPSDPTTPVLTRQDVIKLLNEVLPDMINEEISGTIDEKVENAVSGEIENKIGEYFEDTRIIWEP